MKNYFQRVLFTGVVFFIFSAVPTLAFSGAGAGTSGSPYIITSCTQLAEIDSSLTSYYLLNSNIDCGAYGNFTPIGQLGNFSGTLDGQGYTISNLTINGGSNSFQGLFQTTNGATIKNLMLFNEVVTAPAIVGGLMARSIGNTTISKVSISSSTLTATSTSGASYLGGLVGYWFGANKSLTITDSYVDATITGGGYWVGGLIGDVDAAANMSTVITRSYVAGIVSSTRIVGGFIGNMADAANDTLSISDSFVVASTTASTTEVGGFVGTLASGSYATFSNSYYDTHGVASTTLACGYNSHNYSGCTAVNEDNSGVYHFFDTTSTQPLPSWSFTSTWTRMSGYPALYFPPQPYVYTSTSTLAVTEGSTTSSYTISLAIPPTDTVYIGLNATSSLSLSTTTLAFTTSNWNTPQTVVVTGVDDHVGTSTHSALITYNVTSMDDNYMYFAVATTTVVITDNPRPYIFYFNAFQNNYIGSSSTLTGPVYAYVPRRVSSTLYVQYSLDNSTWVSSTLSHALDASNGYASLSTTAGAIPGVSVSGNTLDVYFDWNVGIDLPTTSTPVYLRAIVDDGTQTSTAYGNSSYPATVDTSLTVPGALSASSVTASTAVLALGTPTAEVNFGQYIVYYNTGLTNPTEASTAFSSSSDSNLASESFGGASTITLTGLTASTQYSVNIWAYNAGGHAASSTVITFTTAAASSGGGGGGGWLAPVAPTVLSVSVFSPLPSQTTTLEQAPMVVVATTSVLKTLVKSPVFTRTLRQGNRGVEVKALQIFLNNHGFLVDVSGVGSPGHESSFFGLLLKKALIKFQEAHSDQILAPFQLKKGTGIFGVASRKFINEMVAQE